MTDTYILLKDLPDTKAGTKFIWNVVHGAYVKDGPFMMGTATGASFINAWLKENVENNSEWFRPETKAPPLGIMPEWLHKEKRLKDLQEAMSRYLSEDKEIPPEWIEEEMILNQWLIVRSWKIKCKKYPNYTEDDLRKAFQAGERCELRNDPKNFEDYLKSTTTA